MKTLQPERNLFVFQSIFSNVVLADEINRTPPKTQASCLRRWRSDRLLSQVKLRLMLLFVLATQNPIELEGTYPLPEAQLDRFLLNPVIDYLSVEDEIKMVGETTGVQVEESQAVLTGDDILQLQDLTRQVPAPETVVSYAVAIASASRPKSET